MILYLLMIDSPEDQSKFERIYVTYRKYMYRVAMSVLDNREDSEDAVHQAFVRIAENIEKIDDSIDARIKGLLATVTENCAIDIYRKKKNHPTVSLEACCGIAIEYEGDSGLTKCMAQLPAKYREVIMMKCHYGYSSKETAKILGTTEANVIKIHQRARKKLKAMCKEEGIL